MKGRLIRDDAIFELIADRNAPAAVTTGPERVKLKNLNS
jgi:hypothetical protein